MADILTDLGATPEAAERAAEHSPELRRAVDRYNASTPEAAERPAERPNKPPRSERPPRPPRPERPTVINAGPSTADLFSALGLEVDNTPRPEPLEPPPGPAEAAPPERPRTASGRKAAKQLTARNLADNLLLVAGMLATGITGTPEANPNMLEAEMIAVPLAEILADSTALAKAAKVANPAMLLFGVTMWGGRVYSLYRAAHPRPPRPPRPLRSEAAPGWGGIIRGRKPSANGTAEAAGPPPVFTPEAAPAPGQTFTPGPMPADLRGIMELDL